VTILHRLCVSGAVAGGVLFTAGSVVASTPAPPDPEPAAEQAFTSESAATFGTLSATACWIDPSGAPITCFGFTDDLSVIVGVAQPNGSFTFTEYSLVDRQPDVVAPTTTTAASAEDASFAVQYQAASGNLLAEATTYSEAASKAITDFEIAEAAVQAQLAADAYDVLHDIAITTSGAGTPLAQATVTAMDTCSGAWQAAADALSAFDIDAINAATILLDECSDDLTPVTDALG
jgi:hypothetical protein